MYSKKSLVPYFLANRYVANSNLFEDMKQLNYSVVKGEALSLYAYGKVGERVSADIDILISKKSIKYLEDCLKKNGFSCCCSKEDNRFLRIYSHQLGVWSKSITPLDSLSVDINHDLFWGEYSGKRIDVEEFLFDNIEINIYGVKVKAVPPLKMLIHLMLHNYKDLNSIFLLTTRKKIKQTMFLDTYNLIMNNTKNISVEILYNKCEEYQILPYAYYVLYYTGQLFPNKLINKYIDAFKTEEGVKLLNCYGLSENERKTWRFDFQTRLDSNNIYNLIKDDLNDFDRKKIETNKYIMMGG